MTPKLKEKIMESLAAVLPITGIVLALSVLLVPLNTGAMMMFFVGAVMLIFGMGMFQLGAEMAMSPLGEGIGTQISKSKKIITILIIAFALGTIITIAEPDLQVLAEQIPSIPNKVIIWTVALGVGIFLALAVLRIVKGIDLSNLLMALYAVLLVLSFFVPDDFLAVAFDSGGVTTGPITVPFIMAVGVGLSSIRSDKNAASDSFGLVALSSVGPILAVVVLGFFYKTDGAYSASELLAVETMQDVMLAFAHALPHYAYEVFVSLLPIAAVFAIFQLLTRRYSRRVVLKSLVGFLYTYLGLVLFLCGVNVGFAPVGTLLGRGMAASDFKWLLIPIGMLIGYFIVKAEPAIQILNSQVQTVTNGAISAKSMNRCLSIGVAVSVGLAMVRVLTGLGIQYIIIPGYLIALILSKFVPKIFVGIAFDSGGVASGPMTSTFLLPLCIGACEGLAGNVMTDAFGVVALVALTPLIAIQLMGVQYRIKLMKLRNTVEPETLLPEVGDDDIVEIEEE
ncbi:MAG: DUF1538 domain-containing protein [Clostridia bacterium]|nr:DUF1538 domain-containing protein [Clostridia bacterium]MBQ8862434.1 DUF1538 domain-containing protein [Clostridia bacterium]